MVNFTGGFGGGCPLVIQGDGFDEHSTAVTIDGNDCHVNSVTATEIECESPANDNYDTLQPVTGTLPFESYSES